MFCRSYDKFMISLQPRLITGSVNNLARASLLEPQSTVVTILTAGTGKTTPDSTGTVSTTPDTAIATVSITYRPPPAVHHCSVSDCEADDLLAPLYTPQSLLHHNSPFSPASINSPQPPRVYWFPQVVTVSPPSRLLDAVTPMDPYLVPLNLLFLMLSKTRLHRHSER